ncbi:hypothetical protein DUI87_20593 [Hirundo rustica rustica]|uniref:Integrase catalytic domain-containing protein n=1 Tax=Hirundo rustica rustica TaxID=333673 RepID=A0A3M0JQY1_HIRRU|nr:hypothetical protein DUI87_20593 [Hirundo rustica rustica]
MEMFKKRKKIIQILLEASFAIKSKVKGPTREIQFLGVKWQDGWRQIPTEVINKITVMSPLTSKKKTQAFLGAIGFWRMHIPEYSQIVSPLYLVTCSGKRYVLTMVEATTGWLETYPVPHATAWNTILGLEKQILWRHGTPERIESDNGTHFKNSLINTWAREHSIEWVYHIPYHVPAAGKVEGYLKPP